MERRDVARWSVDRRLLLLMMLLSMLLLLLLRRRIFLVFLVFWAAAPKGAMSFRIGGFCPVRTYVRPSPPR